MVLDRKVETATYKRLEATQAAPRVRDNKGLGRGSEGPGNAKNREKVKPSGGQATH